MTGLPEVRVQVHEPGQGEQPVRVDHGRTCGVETGTDGGDQRTLEADVGTRAVDELRAADEVCGHATVSFWWSPVRAR